MGLPHSAQNLPLFTAPQVQVQPSAAVAGLDLPHSGQNFPVAVAPQAHCQLSPAGFGSVEASTAVITGLMAKESVVSTLAVLSGVDAESAQMVSVMRQIFPSTLAAVSFLVFVLLYMPCVAAVAAMRREMESSRWAYGTIAAQTALAWTLATLVFQLGRLLGLG